MRVIAGRAGGVRLVSPKAGVRPTMDRVKAAIFSSLGEMVIGARVLDLFAGTGALGIEALSRGAESAIFVEEDRQSIAAIEKNLAKTGFEGRIRQQDVFSFLKNAGSEKFRIVFADPPYEKMKSGEQFTQKLLDNEDLPNLVEPRGIFVLEKRPIARKPTVLRKFFFSHRFANDPPDLQPALADRTHFLFAGLFGEDVSARKLPREIRSTVRPLRSTTSGAALLEETNLAARGQRRGNNNSAEAGAGATRVGARFELRAHDHDDHRVRVRKSKCARLGRRDLQPARFLANHAPGL